MPPVGAERLGDGGEVGVLDVAAVAEVSVSPEGKLKIHRIVAATDCGYAVNPQQIEAQIEGSFVYGLGAALFQECTVKDGAIEQKNFDTYPSLKIDQMPKVESIVMPSGGFWGGVGEPTIAVDTHIFRVANRTGLAPGKDVRAVEDKLLMVVPAEFMLDAHHWLILHGRYVCQARKPLCHQCAVSAYCDYKPKTTG